MRFAAMCKTEFIRTRKNFNIDLQPATCNLQLAVYRDMQYAWRGIFRLRVKDSSLRSE